MGEECRTHGGNTGTNMPTYLIGASRFLVNSVQFRVCVSFLLCFHRVFKRILHRKHKHELRHSCIAETNSKYKWPGDLELGVCWVETWLEKRRGRAWSGLVCLGTPSGGLLWTRWWRFGCPQSAGGFLANWGTVSLRVLMFWHRLVASLTSLKIWILVCLFPCRRLLIEGGRWEFGASWSQY
jgi:hypothetical protein